MHLQEGLTAPREDLGAMQEQHAPPQQLPQQPTQADLPQQHAEHHIHNPLEQHMHMQPDQTGHQYHADPTQHGQPGFPPGLQPGLQPGQTRARGRAIPADGREPDGAAGKR